MICFHMLLAYLLNQSKIYKYANQQAEKRGRGAWWHAAWRALSINLSIGWKIKALKHGMEAYSGPDGKRLSFVLWPGSAAWENVVPHSSHLSLPALKLKLQYGQGSLRILDIFFHNSPSFWTWNKLWSAGLSFGNFNGNGSCPFAIFWERDWSLQFISIPVISVVNPIAINIDPHSIIPSGPRMPQNKTTPSSTTKNAEIRRKIQAIANRAPEIFNGRYMLCLEGTVE